MATKENVHAWGENFHVIAWETMMFIIMEVLKQVHE